MRRLVLAEPAHSLCGRDTRGILKEEEEHTFSRPDQPWQPKSDSVLAWFPVQPHIPTVHFPCLGQYGLENHSLDSLRAPERLPTACRIYPKLPCYLWAPMATTATSASVPSFALTKLLTEPCSKVFHCVPSHQADFCLRIRCSLPHQSSSLLGDPLYHHPMYLAVSRCWELCSRSTFSEGLHFFPRTFEERLRHCLPLRISSSCFWIFKV